MTPDELFTRMHRQRADLIAMRNALEDLTMCLQPDLRDGWLSALRARTAKVRKEAGQHPEPTRQALLDAAQAQERLLTVLEQAAMRSPDDD